MKKRYQRNGGTLVKMYSDELASLINSNKHIKASFDGIFSVNNIPHSIEKKKFVIINTAPSSHDGLHWVLLLRSSQKKYEYFDSLGADLKFMKENLPIDGTVYYFASQLQSNDSKACGLFVVYFIYERIYNMDLSFKNVVNSIFTLNHKSNEDRVVKFFRRQEELT